MVQVAVLGHGVVGSGVVELLEKNADIITKRAGKSIVVKHILDLREFPELGYADKFTKDFAEILADPEVKVIAEAMGGIEPAFTFIKQSLEAGKSVVTSNKELVAARGAQLLAIAAKHHVNFMFEASVGGGVPMIRPLHQCLGANRISEIAGILNGTTNFILTKMIRESMSFTDALAMAQKLGYAEADPAADIEGIDAARKICILASLAFGEHIYPENVFTEGITTVTLEDIQYAHQAGYVIKLIGRTKPSANGKVHIMVGPAWLPKESQLAGIGDVFNGVLIRGDATDDVLFYGKGAGKFPTASAVVADMMDCAKAAHTSVSLTWADSTQNNVADYLENPTQLYVRLEGNGVAEYIQQTKATPITRPNQPQGEHAFVTPLLPEKELRQQLQALETAGATLLQTIRLLEY